eukprot:1149127-Pelagomonas_calceolata.AAC.1
MAGMIESSYSQSGSGQRQGHEMDSPGSVHGQGHEDRLTQVKSSRRVKVHTYSQEAVTGRDMRIDSMRPPVLRPNVVPLQQEVMEAKHSGDGTRSKNAGRNGEILVEVDRHMSNASTTFWGERAHQISPRHSCPEQVLFIYILRGTTAQLSLWPVAN